MHQIFIKIFSLLFILLFSILSIQSREVFFVGSSLHYNGDLITLDFDNIPQDALGIFASSNTGNIAFFRIIWKEQDDEHLKYLDIRAENGKLLGFATAWFSNTAQDLIEIEKKSIAFSPEDLIHMYAQRGYIIKRDGVTYLEDQISSSTTRYCINGETGSIQLDSIWQPLSRKNLPRNFKHSEQYFLDFIYFLYKSVANLVNSKSPIEFVLLQVISSNSPCNNCFHALQTLLNGTTDLKAEFLQLFFGEYADPANTPMNILYITAKFPSYRNDNITNAWKETKEFIDLKGENALFIHVSFPLQKERERTNKAIIYNETLHRLLENAKDQLHSLTKHAANVLWHHNHMNRDDIARVLNLQERDIDSYIEYGFY